MTIFKTDGTEWDYIKVRSIDIMRNFCLRKNLKEGGTNVR
jgi:hypothetical protein